MKPYSKTQLKEKAKEVFNAYPAAETLHATSDGQFFIEKNRAELHADENKLQVIEIEKDWAASTGSVTSSEAGDDDIDKDEHHLSVDELQEKAKACTDTAELKKWLEDEQNAEKPRKTAIACLEKRLKELETEKLNEKK